MLLLPKLWEGFYPKILLGTVCVNSVMINKKKSGFIICRAYDMNHTGWKSGGGLQPY